MSSKNSRTTKIRVWPKNLLYTFITILGVLSVTAGTIWLLRFYGLEAAVVLVVAGTAAFWGWVIRWLWKDGRMTLSHILVIWMVGTGTLLGGASYYFAYRGIDANLETLSRYIMVEVVAGIGGYFIKSGVEYVSRNKNRVIESPNFEDDSSTKIVDL